MSKTILFQAIQFNQRVIIQTIQFSISIVFIYTQLKVKTVLFQTIQFSIQRKFHFKQFSFALIHSLNVKTVLFQAVQFITSMQFSSIRPINRALSGATTPSQRGFGSDDNEGYSVFPKAPALLEPHHQIV